MTKNQPGFGDCFFTSQSKTQERDVGFQSAAKERMTLIGGLAREDELSILARRSYCVDHRVWVPAQQVAADE